MSDLVPASSAAPAIPDDDAMVGLEDFDESDIVMPTIKIEHQEGVFVDNLSNERFEVLECVVLGLVKGRIMWDREVNEDEPPLCRSLDFTVGLPGPKFPWEESGFAEPTDKENAQIACADCPLKEWGSHPTRDNVPWCNEQHTYVIGLPNPARTVFAPAILTIKSSGIKPSKAYISGFARAKTPMFVNMTTITLEQMKRGSVKYCIPKFAKGATVDESFFDDFKDQYRMVRSFLQTPRVRHEDSEADVVRTASEPAPAAAAASSPVYGDDLPF